LSKIRITGGEWRSRLVKVTEAPGLRPTPDRVRETLFNWLGQDLTGLSCLDLFAGSGILGFEAASRGARPVVFVEHDAKVFRILDENTKILNPTCFERVCSDALKFAPFAIGQGRRFDLILLDPPYRQGWLDKLWPLLPELAADQGRIYVEAETAVQPPDPWQVVKSGRAGQVFYHLLERA